MDDQDLPLIRQLFEVLDARRHLPGYRLEGRLAPLFELFLLRILGERFAATPLHPVMIPEFPLRIGTLYGPDRNAWPKPRSERPRRLNQSCKVDYVLFSADLHTVFLVELKTDIAYWSRQQDAYLQCARQIPFGRFVEATRTIARASDLKSKYVHLLHLLSALGLLSLDRAPALQGLPYPRTRSEWNDALDRIRFRLDGRLADTRIVYILPEPKEIPPRSDTYIITFPEFTQTIRDSGEAGRIFADYLDRWAEQRPGSRDPRCHRSAP